MFFKVRMIEFLLRRFSVKSMIVLKAMTNRRSIS